MFTNRLPRAARGTAAFCVLLLAAGIARADIPGIVFEITAEAGQAGAGHSTSFQILAEWGDYDRAGDVWTWTMPEPHEFWHEGTFLGRLDTFTATIVGDPEVNLSFSVQAGAADTAFHIGSALLSDFDPITDAIGYAHASYTLTDFDANSAALTGVGDTGGAYLAQYNGWAGDPFGGPQGTTFAEGIFSMSAGFLETVTDDFDYPESGYVAIEDTVYDMSSLVSFTLTAQDLASGTSSYVIVPEPATLALLVLGTVAMRVGRRNA
jgi:hypothetical protein